MDINILDTNTVLMIVVGVLALGMSFLSLKIGAFAWFITCFLWVAEAVLIKDNSWASAACGVMAFLCIAMMIANKKR